MARRSKETQGREVPPARLGSGSDSQSPSGSGMIPVGWVKRVLSMERHWTVDLALYRPLRQRSRPPSYMTTPLNPVTPLTGSHLRAYNTIFQHPVSHNLGWHDVLALFRHLGTVEEEHNGNTKLTRNGQVLVLHPHHSKDVAGTEEVIVLRHFLERSEPMPTAAAGKLRSRRIWASSPIMWVTPPSPCT